MKQIKSTQHVGIFQHRKTGMNKPRKITRKLKKAGERWLKIKGN